MSISQHIASIRSRAAQQHRISDAGDQATADTRSRADELNSESLSKLSVLSLSDDDDPARLGESSGTRRGTRDDGDALGRDTTGPRGARAPAGVVFSSLGSVSSVPDIEMNLDATYSQWSTLRRLDNKWSELSENLNETLAHLEDCSFQVTNSAAECLGSLSDCVDSTCDKIDAQVKAFYDLMTKCDELTTKLSAASSFRDEIKTLRKTIETLDQLSRTKPPVRGQAQPDAARRPS